MTHPWIAKQVRLAMARLFKSHTKIPASLANLTEKDQKYLIEMLLASHLCQALTKRYYILGSEYETWPTIIANLVMQFFDPEGLSILKNDIVFMIGAINAYAFAFNNYPVYTIDPILIDYLEKTDLPESFNFQQTTPLFFFILPKNYFIDDEGESVNYLFAHTGIITDLMKPHPSPEYQIWFNFVKSLKEQQDKYTWENQSITGEPISILFANRYINWAKRILTNGKLITSENNVYIGLKGKGEATNRLIHLAVHLLCLIHYHPNLIKTESLVTKPMSGFPSGFGKRSLKPFYPRHLGLSATWDEQYKSIAPGSQKGTETRTVSTHWRRGHWRWISKNQHSVWVRPTLVKPPKP